MPDELSTSEIESINNPDISSSSFIIEESSTEFLINSTNTEFKEYTEEIKSESLLEDDFITLESQSESESGLNYTQITVLLAFAIFIIKITLYIKKLYKQ